MRRPTLHNRLEPSTDRAGSGLVLSGVFDDDLAGFAGVEFPSW